MVQHLRFNSAEAEDGFKRHLQVSEQRSTETSFNSAEAENGFRANYLLSKQKRTWVSIQPKPNNRFKVGIKTFASAFNNGFKSSRSRTMSLKENEKVPY